ncbi:MAG: hypothetical protein JWM61_1203, partial [Micrococcaceae bacterium]|nr:hypothetical protein [Micrococcaceae bacterium]
KPPTTPDETRPPVVRITPVPAGKDYVTPLGVTTVATHDVVLLDLLDRDGNPEACLIQPPDAATGLALFIRDAAAALIKQEIDDDGKKLSLPTGIKRLNKAFDA